MEKNMSGIKEVKITLSGIEIKFNYKKETLFIANTTIEILNTFYVEKTVNNIRYMSNKLIEKTFN